MTITYGALGQRGRLGNALFELAATIGVADRLGAHVRFPDDWIHRRCFSVPDDLFGPCDGLIEAWDTPVMSYMDWRARPYMQDVHLFERLLPTLWRHLTPSPEAQSEIDVHTDFFALPRPILGVHVRRGDNVPGADPNVPDKQRYFVLPGFEYYDAAIRMLRPQAASVAVFSDDIAWCREHIDADYYHPGVPRPKEHEPDYLTAPTLDHVDLQLLGFTDLLVVTGSTYGIWGALLSGSQHVIRPKEVYGPALSYIDSDLLFLNQWTPIHVNGHPC